MLLWEHLGTMGRADAANDRAVSVVTRQTQRLPYDTRCAALNKSGKRCRGKVLPNREWCFCHDPESAAKRQARAANGTNWLRRRLSHLPDGYLRKLTDRRSIGLAMDRLYREVRLEIITPEMGRVLFDVLSRLLDSGLGDQRRPAKSPMRTKAERLRPKLAELLTRAERVAWRKAVANAPASVLRSAEEGNSKPPMEKAIRPGPVENGERALTMPFQVAS
jgi:hypothetical protein